MVKTLAVANYRSLHELVLPLARLNVVTGANGSGKSNVYRALRLLAASAQGGVTAALAAEGGIGSALWAGPREISPRMRRGEVEIQGTQRTGPVALRLGFAGEDYGYVIDLGLPIPGESMFNFDPEIKRECIFAGDFLRSSNVLVDRRGSVATVRDGRERRVLEAHLDPFRSLFEQIADPERAPEVLRLREEIRAWRFYDHFRCDAEAPARQSRLGTRTPVLAPDGRDLAAAWQTIREIGDRQALDDAVDDAFPGAQVEVEVNDGRFDLRFMHEGLLRPLATAELSDGTLRYLLWVAALMSPRPPPLMVLNEPETSLHPDLLPALGRLIAACARRTQVWVVSHAPRLIAALEEAPECNSVPLDKRLGETVVAGRHDLDEPRWEWPAR